MKITVIVIVGFITIVSVSAVDNKKKEKFQLTNLTKNETLETREITNRDGRRIKKHIGGLFGHFGPFGGGLMGYGITLPALAILYFLKVKVVIVAFFVGTAIALGTKFFLAKKLCPKEISYESPVYAYNHGPSWSSYDHIPYSTSYLYNHHKPTGYHSSFNLFDSAQPSTSESEDYGSDKTWNRESRQFSSVGTINSEICHRRFICEWQFKSKRAPIKVMFQLFGSEIFTNYLTDSSGIRSFDECGRVYSGCKFTEKEFVNSMSSTSEKSLENTNEDLIEEINDISLNNDKLQKNDPDDQNQSANNTEKEKNSIAETLFNSSRLNLHLVPIES